MAYDVVIYNQKETREQNKGDHYYDLHLQNLHDE